MTHSSKPSLDGAQSPASPFLQNLAHRLRKGSTASHASSQSSESNQGGPEPPALETTSSTKRYLLSIVRNDWDYPLCANDPYANRRPVGYRQRDESISDGSSLGSAGEQEANKVYKFDNPDEVGVVVSQRKLKKKRQLDEEMSWNDGLRLWSERRDAWTGAVAHKPPNPSPGDASGRRRRSRKWVDSLQHHRNSSESTANTTSSNLQGTALRDSDQPRNSSSSFEPFPPMEEQTAPEDEGSNGLGPYLPIYPPLLPASHALRARIKPTAYPTIYSRVVIQSMTPNVPIPLNYMIDALVDGWKSEGNWPPQAAAHGDTLARGIYTPRKKKGETAFTRWRREQEERKRLALERMEKLEREKGGNPTPHQEEKPQSRMRKSISGAMRKVLGKGEEDDVIGRDLAELGLKFEDETADGALLEARAVAEAFQEEENVLLNKALLNQT